MDSGSFEDEMEVQDFEPLQRERSNTWHGDFVFMDSRSPQFSVMSEKAGSARESENEMLRSEDQKIDGEAYDETSVEMVPPADHGSSKKGSVRRNAWGNASYAELIAQAIESSPDKRLTLTQIYEWMIKNNPYFQSRSDGPSSMGWKNSIRHNLSLHNQFSRVQNEGAGKSSWWVVNRSFVKCKLPSRRATMGDPGLLDRKRSRVNKKLKGQGNDFPPNPEENSSPAPVSRKIRTISEANETFIEIDQKSPISSMRSSKLVCASGVTGSTDNLEREISLVGDKLAVSGNIEHIQWQAKKETQDRDSNMTTAQSTLSYVVCSGVPLALQQSQLGFPMSQSSQQQQQQAGNSIILKVQQNKIQNNYFETNKISSPIVVYVASPEKQNLIQTLDNQLMTTGNDSSRSLDVPNNISSIMMSDLNKQTNQMSLVDNQAGSQRNAVSFNISEKRRKMLMELLHSERFCQLRRQNPELNKKIIDMLQRKKNMLLMKGAKPYLSSEQCFESAERYLGILPENHSDLGSYKLVSNSMEIRPSVHHQNNFAGSILKKSDNFVDSFDFTQSNSFQVDIDQAIGDVDFDGSIDDLFGVNGLLINCEDELNSLAHDFTS